MNALRYPLLLGTTLILVGCDRDSDRPKNNDEHPIRIPHVTEYRSSDPNLEPTLTLGRKVEFRTRDGGAVVLRSEVERQKKAAEEQRRGASTETSK